MCMSMSNDPLLCVNREGERKKGEERVVEERKKKNKEVRK